jgi:hypothetical protein
MADRERPDDERDYEQRPEDRPLVILLRSAWSHWRLIVVTTLTITVIAVVLSVIDYRRQPTVWVASLEFRPVFKGAEFGAYPNDLLFAPSDITDSSVLDQVYDANKIQDFCPSNDFRASFLIQRQSAELLLIDSDYQSRLAEPRLTVVDRQRLLDEYRSRRAGAPLQYALSFIRPSSCHALPEATAIKVLDDILLTWATDSEKRRGVLNQRVRVLTPNVLDAAAASQQSLFVRANLVWTNMARVIRNIQDVENLPGAALVRFGEKRVSLAEVKARLDDLQHAQLQPLMTSGGAWDRESVRWIEDALATASSQQQVAQNRARANLEALREYSGVQPTPGAQAGGESSRGSGAADVQSLTPQIDRTFIDRILEMSAPNTTFRQELTREMVRSSLDAVELESVVNHYKYVLASLKAGGTGASQSDIAARLAEIVAEGKELTRQFNGLYEEWSNVSFRPAPAMYRTERPGAVAISRPRGASSYGLAVAIAFLVGLMISVLIAWLHSRVWPMIVVVRQQNP